ncbi:hypothetical protein FAZ95_13725 [Trinickia violacea]|uniref:Uncharacterized protein n=1 Tax=Trinickia violacea TaxID=2571746 RepID=A0A4P8IMG1_9BURK|nr:hypothetical protein [Trinickia violacea]QCP50142.1 hypothetical protein FAZ95_13725 [Trinickia violacea]
MEWSDIAAGVGSAAPVISRLLDGPAGAAVGALIAAVLGTDATPPAVSAALASDPDAPVKLQGLQANVKALVQQLAATAELNRPQAAAASYTSQAIGHDSAPYSAAHPPHDWVRPAITFWLLSGGLGIVAAILSGTADELLKNPTASMTVGALIAQWFNELKGSLSFYFRGATEHSTQSAADKGTADHGRYPS